MCDIRPCSLSSVVSCFYDIHAEGELIFPISCLFMYSSLVLYHIRLKIPWSESQLVKDAIKALWTDTSTKDNVN